MKIPTLKPPKKGQLVDSSKMVLQGYDLTTSRYKVSLYQKRMMMAIVEAAQADLQGEKHVAGREIKLQSGSNPIVSIPMNIILQDDDSSNLFAVKRAAKEFVGKVIEHEDSDGNWVAFSPIITACIPRYASTIELQVNGLFWNAVLNFRKGYRKLDVKKAIALKSVYAIRFYELMSGKKDPIVYSIAELKAMFCLKDKYKQINDFVRFVLEPAKRELDMSAPYSFDFEPVKDGRKIIGFRFTPLHYPQHEAPDAEEKELQRRLNLSWDIRDRHVRDYLMNSIGFTEVEIRNNLEVFRRASELLPDFLNELAILKGKSRDKNNPKGWIIRALEGKIKDFIEELGKNEVSDKMADIAMRMNLNK